MWIKPCGHRLLVKPFKQVEVDEVMKKHSEFLKDFKIINSNEKREDASVDVGVVLEIGPTAWHDFKSVPWCKVGDTIVYSKFAGKFLTNPFDDTAEAVFILNDEDVVGVFTKE